MINIKSGYVSILGLPNAGKSTLMNALLGQKLSIITIKPQTTRKKIIGILSEPEYQIIFLDTPGVLKPAYLLQQKMVAAIEQSIKDSDVILLMMDCHEDPVGNKLFNQQFVQEIILRSSKPKILILNKADLSTQEKISFLISKFEKLKLFKEIIPTAVTLNFNVESIKPAILHYLPYHPKYYPDDIIADANERFFVSEIIREKILEQYKEEIPYSVEVVIADFKERETGKDFIQAEIVVEKETQKAILIGKDGEAIKKLGKNARKAIEDFLGREVFLDLRVKVRKNWRSNENFLKAFGYSIDDK